MIRRQQFGPLLLILLCLLFSVGVVTIHQKVFLAMPYLTDENAYLFQARTFSMGRLWVPSPPAREFFDTHWMINNGRYYSKYFPGHAALLTPGILAGHDHAMPLLFSAFCLPMLYLIGRRLFDGPTALIACLIYAVSPSALLTAGTYLSQTSTVFLTLCWIYFLVRSPTPSMVTFLGGGAVFAVIALCRPYTAFSLLIPSFLFVWTLSRKDTRKKNMGRHLVSTLLAGLLVLAVFLVYNRAVTGDAFQFPHFMEGRRDFDKPGFFTPVPEHSAGFTPLDALSHLAENVVLHGRWGMGTAAFFLFAAIRLFEKPRWIAFLFLSPLLSLMIFHFPFFGQTGSDVLYGWGALYYMESVPFTSLVAASGIGAVASTLRKATPKLSRAFMILLTIGLCWISAGSLAERIANTTRVQSIQKSVLVHIQAQRLSKAVVFVRSGPHPWNIQGTWPASYFISNSPGFDDEVLIVQDLGEKNISLVKAFGDRKAYSIEYDAGRFRLNFGPLP